MRAFVVTKLPTIARVGPDTAVFLFNYNSKELHGPYLATAAAQLNIDKEAWKNSAPKGKGRGGNSPYPAQLRVVPGDGHAARKDATTKYSSGPLDAGQGAG